MESLAIATCHILTSPQPYPRFCELRASRRETKKLCFRLKNRKKLAVLSASGSDRNNGGEFDKWDMMEMKFGQMMGEDPNLTLAKIRGRKADPDASYLEIEKTFHKKGKSGIIEEVPFDVPERKKRSDSLNGLNLSRPVPKKGVKFEVDNKPIKSKVKVPSELVKKPVNTRATVPNVILRKPTTFSEDDVGLKESPKLYIKPNIVLREQTKDNFTDMTLLRKPDPMISDSNTDKEQTTENFSDMTLLKKPDHMISSPSVDKEQELSSKTKAEANDDRTLLAQRPQLKQWPESCDEYDSPSSTYVLDVDVEGANSSTDNINRINDADGYKGDNASLSSDSGADGFLAGEESGVELDDKPAAALIGKPNRLDQNVKGTRNLDGEQSTLVNPDNYENAVKLEGSASSLPIQEFEENDWRRLEDLLKTSGRDDVELVSASTRGFVVSFGSLIGFLPYRNLSPRWKFLAFESWLRGKGLDPSKYKQNLGIIGNNGIPNEASLDPKDGPKINEKVDPDISPDMGLDDLLRIYDQEKLKFLSSFVGQKIKVNVTLADRKTRRLIFSLKPKEKEEMIDKKRNLMAKLSVGDVVKCQIKKITYFGIFVELEGVPALIHQTEVSWDATLDPASYFKLGQIVEAKVHQLDFSLGRIFLSLKEITPDPLMEALEAVIGDKNSLDGRLEAAQDDEEWADVESLIKELQQFGRIDSVSKGRFFLSPGLAPTFQVYMASMFENEFKLLARAGNKVQEVIVRTSLGKEEMKSAILTCTNRVE